MVACISKTLGDAQVGRTDDRQSTANVCHMDDRLTREPLYRQVAARLRREITSGEYAGDQAKLPSESELMDKYGVARDTIRRAVASLQADGLVNVVHGRGTFVRTPPLRLPSSRFGQQARKPGIGPFELACQLAEVPGHGEVVTVENIPADDDVAIGLDVELGAPVIHRQRHMHAGDPDRVIQIQDGYLPADLVAGTVLAGREKIRDGIYAALDSIGYPVHFSTETVSARMATPDEAKILGIRNGIPVIVIRRSSYGPDGQIVEWSRVVAAADANEFVYERLPQR